MREENSFSESKELKWTKAENERQQEKKLENKNARQTERAEKDCSETQWICWQSYQQNLFYSLYVPLIANLFHWHPEMLTCEANPRCDAHKNMIVQVLSFSSNCIHAYIV